MFEDIKVGDQVIVVERSVPKQVNVKRVTKNLIYLDCYGYNRIQKSGKNQNIDYGMYRSIEEYEYRVNVFIRWRDEVRSSIFIEPPKTMTLEKIDSILSLIREG